MSANSGPLWVSNWLVVGVSPNSPRTVSVDERSEADTRSSDVTRLAAACASLCGLPEGVDGPSSRSRGLQNSVDCFRSALHHLAGRDATLQGRDPSDIHVRCSTGFNRSIPGGVSCPSRDCTRELSTPPTMGSPKPTRQKVVRLPMHLRLGSGEV
eukprot:1297500-Amphidinium_carterae.2